MNSSVAARTGRSSRDGRRFALPYSDSSRVGLFQSPARGLQRRTGQEVIDVKSRTGLTINKLTVRNLSEVEMHRLVGGANAPPQAFHLTQWCTGGLTGTCTDYCVDKHSIYPK